VVVCRRAAVRVVPLVVESAVPWRRVDMAVALSAQAAAVT
jgi:hypothetical protein